MRFCDRSGPREEQQKIRSLSSMSLSFNYIIISNTFRLSFKKVWDQLLKGLQAFADLKSAETEAHAKGLELHKGIYKKFVRAAHDSFLQWIH